MGYTTDFSGAFMLNRPLSKDQAEYLRMFSQSRHMKRDVQKIVALPDSEKNDECLELLDKLHLGFGIDGEFYCGKNDYDDASVLCNGNVEPSTQPGLWCQWTVGPRNDTIEWDGGEKFYNYTEWLHYIIKNFIQPWGLSLSGEILWVGEDPDDRGKIVVTDNKMTVYDSIATYAERQETNV